MFCVSSIETLVKYYDLFQAKKVAGEHNLRIATIFSYAANEEDPDANGFITSEDDEELEINKAAEPKAAYSAGSKDSNVHSHSRDKL